MIARIEALRDAADAVDTRIRVVPDALGAIDVDIRRDGDLVHVRFTADQPQTRAILQDAQPRLAEAAETRGLRLGQTSVEGAPGSPGSGTGATAAPSGSAANTAGSNTPDQGRQRHSAPDPRRPASAFPTPRDRPADADDDARIA